MPKVFKQNQQYFIISMHNSIIDEMIFRLLCNRLTCYSNNSRNNRPAFRHSRPLKRRPPTPRPQRPPTAPLNTANMGSTRPCIPATPTPTRGCPQRQNILNTNISKCK